MSKKERHLAKLQGRQMTAQHVQFSRWAAPLPPPETLAEYDKIVPGLAKQLADTAAGQAKHRQKMESRGQVFSFMLLLAGMGVGALLLLKGYDLYGLVALVVALGPNALAGLRELFRKRGSAVAAPDAQGSS